MHITSNTLDFLEADNVLIFVIWCNSDLNIHLLSVSCRRKEEPLRHDDVTNFVVRDDQYGPLRYRVSESIMSKNYAFGLKHADSYTQDFHLILP